jgi:hypothetical protein
MKMKNVILPALVAVALASCSEVPQAEQQVKDLVNDQVSQTIKDLGLSYVEEGAKQVITYDEVNAAQQAWCDGLEKICQLYTSGGDYKTFTEQFITETYNYDFGKVFFKPTLAYGDQTFRTTKEGAIAYFIGGNPNFPADKGFALNPWTEVRYDNLGTNNEGIQIYGSVAITMGNVWVKGPDGKEVMVDKTFVFKKGSDGKLRLIVHKSSLPFAPAA